MARGRSQVSRREWVAPAARPRRRLVRRSRQIRSRGRAPVTRLWRALALTVVSAFVWGVAHLAAGRRLTGFALMSLLVVLISAGGGIALAYGRDLVPIVVQRGWLNGIAVGIVVLALLWGLIVIRSYQVVRPAGLPPAMRITAGSLVVIMAAAVSLPLVYAANATYVLRNALGNVFADDSGEPVDAADPWRNTPRLNILLLGGDGGRDRTGIRTDSITVASIDTRTGDSVLIGVPRGLQRFPVPPRLRSRWPAGYTGDPGDQGLINELYIEAERHPELVPGAKSGRRGPRLLEETVGHLLGLKIHYYALVNLAGFEDIVDAVGGVRVRVEKPLPIGGDPARGIPPVGYLRPGLRELNGEQALWYGRSRHADDDFHRMDRQKCLMKAIVDQADPQTVITRVNKLATAARRTIATNIPAELLPALVKLSNTVKRDANIRSLPFNPDKVAGFRVYQPNIAVMRAATAKAIADSSDRGPATAASRTNASQATRNRPDQNRASAGTAAPARPGTGAVSLKNICG